MPHIPPDKHSGWSSYLTTIWPGLLACIIIGTLAKWFDTTGLPQRLMINHVLVAVLLGAAARNLFPRHYPRFREGAEVSARVALYAGIVLLGAGLDLGRLLSIGAAAIGMVAISITACIAIAGLITKRLGIGSRWGHLLGAGIGVCGISAAMALAPVIKARDRELVTVIGTLVITDILMLICVPVAAGVFGWSQTLAGFMSGAAPANTAQCVAIGHACGVEAGQIATVVKSARNALLPVMILIMTAVYAERGAGAGRIHWSLLWSRFPKFIVGLVAAAVLTTTGLITPQAAVLAKNVSSWLFVICFAGIGAGINTGELGRRDLLIVGLGLILAVAVSAYVYLYSSLILAL